MSASGRADHDGSAAQRGITGATQRAVIKIARTLHGECVRGVCIGRGSTEFYAAHRFVLGSPALGGVRIYLVRYRGRTRGGRVSRR